MQQPTWRCELRGSAPLHVTHALARTQFQLFKGHNLSARQESVALHYLYSIAQRLEDLNESR